LRREMERLGTDSPLFTPEPEPGPLTLLIAGQPNAGKSSLINALSGRARAVVSPLPCEAGFPVHALEEETVGELALVDSPGLEGPPDNAWLREAARADLVVWVAAAHRADRAVDQQALQTIRERTNSNFRERRSPVILVLTHADRLDPAPEWAPPYDPYDGTRPKERAMRASRDAICTSLDFPADLAVPVMIRNPEQPWNLDEFWQVVHANLPSARQSRLERLLLRRSRLEGVSDAVRTLPGLVKQLASTLKNV
nr:GTPase domain-containing protein [Kiritimatiellia bacterium]